MQWKTVASVAALGLVTALGWAARGTLARAAAEDVPIYEWDPYWPKRPLPNHWVLGNVAGIDVDGQDHVWVLNRPRSLLHGHEDDASYPIPESECCVPPPAIVEFDAQGNVVQGFGGPGPEYEWPGGAEGNAESTNQVSTQKTPRGWDPTYSAKDPHPPRINLEPRPFHWVTSEHSVTVDWKGNVWFGGSHLMEFTRDGKFIKEIGYAPGRKRPDSHNTQVLGGGASIAGVAVDKASNEVFVADGYANRRLIVFDADTGAFKRQWGAYGKDPDDSVKPRKLPFEWKPTDPPPPQFAVAHSVHIDKDGLVYVGDRNNSRIQVFKKDGTYLKEAFIKPTTMRGTVLDFAFSKDPGQKWVFVADGRNDKIWILRRSDLQVVSEFGHGGQMGGEFTIAHAIAADTKNNLYVGESLTGNRVQRFLYRGLKPASHHYDRYGLELK
jgi:DNA-binding beta-propeller fold protein YncE